MDVLRFLAAPFLAVWSNLCQLENAVQAQPLMPAGVSPFEKGHVGRVFSELLVECERLPLTSPTIAHIERCRDLYSDASDMMCMATVTRIQEMKRVVIHDLNQWLFVAVPPRLSPYVHKKSLLFGEEVTAKFAELSEEIRSAGNCMAVAEWTAAVFHLMRVLERGLHKLAKDLDVPMAETIEYENWKNIIDQIESTIRKMEQEKKTPERQQKLQKYSEIASQFWYVKEAWRNHVAHSRVSYNETRAIEIWNATRSLMQRLAEVA